MISVAGMFINSTELMCNQQSADCTLILCGHVIVVTGTVLHGKRVDF